MKTAKKTTLKLSMMTVLPLGLLCGQKHLLQKNAQEIGHHENGVDLSSERWGSYLNYFFLKAAICPFLTTDRAELVA